MAASRDHEGLAPILVLAITSKSSSASCPWDPLLSMLMAALSDEALAPILVPAITAIMLRDPLVSMRLWQHQVMWDWL